MVGKNDSIIPKKAKAIAINLIAHRDELINILLSYESFETARDEIDRSVKALKLIGREKKYLLDDKIEHISTFLPINLPLYSLVLFGIIPSFAAKEIYIRPTDLMHPIFHKVTNILEGTIPANINIQYSQRRDFLNNFASNSNVIIFTGQHQNALNVQKEIASEALFIYNGRGINPFLINSTADIDYAALKCIKTRCFNSGQDCAGPDAIIVHKSILSLFLKKLIAEIKTIKIGSYSEIENTIGQLIKPEILSSLEKFFQINKEKIVHGGFINFSKIVVEPTVLVSQIIQSNDYSQEFFAPVFNVLTYNTRDDLDFYFENQNYLEYAMYVSVFGDSSYINRLKRHSIVLYNRTMLDIDQNTFGGYGRKASYVNYDNFTFPRPILISREIWKYNEIFKKQKHKK